jgi:hypothetical protein
MELGAIACIPHRHDSLPSEIPKRKKVPARSGSELGIPTDVMRSAASGVRYRKNKIVGLSLVFSHLIA